jgi:hypothetical protein
MDFSLFWPESALPAHHEEHDTSHSTFLIQVSTHGKKKVEISAGGGASELFAKEKTPWVRAAVSCPVAPSAPCS